MRALFLRLVFFLLPKAKISLLVRRLAAICWPPIFRQVIVGGFARHYHIDLSEADKALSEYPSIQSLFTRKLRPGVRPLDSGALAISPVDGVISQVGEVRDGQLLQIKGISYSLAEFLGDSGAARDFEGGHYKTFYLCPTDYHRVHSPVDGRLVKVRHFSGALWPVNEWAVQNVPQVFVKNERIVMWLESAYGLVAVVMVAALNVGNMILSFDESPPRESEKIYDPGHLLAKGEELGIFKMGSTVVVIFPKSMSGFQKMHPGPIRLGRAL